MSIVHQTDHTLVAREPLRWPMFRDFLLPAVRVPRMRPENGLQMFGGSSMSALEAHVTYLRRTSWSFSIDPIQLPLDKLQYIFGMVL